MTDQYFLFFYLSLATQTLYDSCDQYSFVAGVLFCLVVRFGSESGLGLLTFATCVQLAARVSFLQATLRDNEASRE